ncbi:flagellar hook protein FlgE [Desulfocurvus sp. DL9XJH121]
MGFQSLYVGSTGLISHGTRMQTLGNNIANVNTVGYKTANSYFETLMSQSLTAGNSSGTGISQLGLGTGIGAVLTDFRDGAVIAGSATTDLAISGKGFFRVVDPAEADTVRYTRAGNFRFDRNGFLVDPHGYRLQGQAVTNGVAGGTEDIHLELDANGQLSIPAEATEMITFLPNIGDLGDNSASHTDPFFSMLSTWNGAAAPPLGEGAYGFSSTLAVYDADGAAHNLTFYFDGVSLSNADGNSYYEFVVAMDPADDGNPLTAGTSAAGLLMSGTLVFDSAGTLQNISTYSYSGTGDVKALSNWAPAAPGAGGYPEITAIFAASSGGTGLAQTMGLNFGISGGTLAAGYASNAGAVGTSASGLALLQDASRSALSATNFEGSSAIIFQSQDGSPTGYLMNLSVDASGMLIGNFSNGVHRDLYQITLYNFTSEFGLRREGGNLYSETLASGQAIEGVPDEENFGVISENSLEQSNVDLADQFAEMIVTERGFQANSKVITTTDQILQILYGMKR